jgi:starch phosphorylase
MDNLSLLRSLSDLALDLRWSWNHAADELWRQLDPELWKLTHNAWLVLQTLPRSRADAVLGDEKFGQRLDSVMAERRERDESRRWFQLTQANSKLTAVAYFSMEFMLSDALPIYSGGLGNVAGDQLKAASDLGVPVIGVGLLYQQGYFRQHIDSAGNQIALRPFNEPGQLPVCPVRNSNGEWLRITIRVPGFDLHIRTWQVQVGRVKLYLLDTNDPENLPEHRGITGELYGGGPELRLQQERVLGIGGWRLVRALGLAPEVCHLNEGHAAFAVLERARCFMEDSGQPFAVALAATRAGNLFTTHTPVAAGFDRFEPALMAARFRGYAEQELRIPLDQLLALGRENPRDASEPFNMAYLAVRGSGAVNGVSGLHGEVSRRIFSGLFPRWPVAEVPVSHVTNGIHTPSWDSIEADELWTTACGKGRWESCDPKTLEERLRNVPENTLWSMRQRARKAMIEYLRDRLARQIEGHGGSEEEVATAARALDPDSLTMGFARRFATYKRPNLLLHDPDRLLRILTNRQRPVQLVLAGKAHPRDLEGQAMIRQWIDFIRRTPARSQAVFLADDDMGLTEQLVRGVDLWLNTPRRPWEASGTSGMKVLANGGLNFSELDGWWAEAYSPDTGWALGDGQEHDDPAWDAHEAEQMYEMLEQQIIPEFYSRDASGLPAGWIGRMRESMARLTPEFSANRAVRQYTEQHYLPLAQAYLERSKDRGRTGASVLEWQRAVEGHWPRLRFGLLLVSTDAGQHTFSVQVWVDELPPDSVEVELFADGQAGGKAVVYPMTRGQALVGSESGFTWTATIPADRPKEDFTPRIVPWHAAANVPLECGQILWYR